MNDDDSRATELMDLLRRTYKGSYYHDSFDDVSVLTTRDNKKYVVGMLRDRDEKYTAGGDYAPHMRSVGTVFVAELDKEGKLTGNSVRIKGEAQETHHYSEGYIGQMIHKSNDDLLNPQKPFTYISIDINQKDKLPRTVVYSDGSIQGNTFGDYTTFVNGYFDMSDRADFLRAAQSDNHPKNFRNHDKNQKIAKLCSLFLVPNESDEKCREEENKRRAANKKVEDAKARVEKMAALRKCIEQDPKALKFLGKGKLHRTAQKALARVKAPKLMETARKEKDQKARKDLDTRRQWNDFRDVIQSIMDNR